MLDRDFGKYRLLKRLGRGGMADVYLAHDNGANRDVALKLVEVKQDRDSLDVLDAERRGAILQDQFGRVDSHVPSVHQYGTEGEYFYIDMEYVDGEDLAEMVGRGPIEDARAAWIAQEICAFLDEAHAFDASVDGRPVHGIIHADIKPRNVRINAAGQVKVLDFGIAKGLALSRKLTRNDFGSLTYLSPERLDTGDVDVHVDFWSVGVLLYEMLAGSTPFREANVQKLEHLIRSRRQPPPLPDRCPARLQRIVFKILAGDLTGRYQSAADIRTDLETFLAGAETQADREWASGALPTDATRRTVSTPAEADAVDAEATRVTRRGPDAEPGQEQPTQRTRGPAALDGPAAAGDEETRRTRRPDESPAPVPPVGAGPMTPKDGPATHRRSRVRTLVVGAVALLLVALFVNEASVWSAARELRASLPSRQESEMSAAWTEYDRLSHRSVLGFGLIGVRRPLKDRLLAQAERVIADYRQDAPAVREAQWKDAVAWLTNASRLDPADTEVNASLQYCEAHLYRINGETQKRKRLPSAMASLHAAIVRFEEAGRLNRKWPDPYLGLARTYVYGLEDLDRAISAFEEAQRRGYRPGNRELVQLADGYRNRAERMRREATGMQGLPQEAELLQKSADDFQRAVDLYRQAIGFGEAGATMRQVQKRLDEVQQALTELRNKGSER